MLPNNLRINEEYFDDSFFESIDSENLQVTNETELIRIIKNYLVQGYDIDIIIDMLSDMFNMDK